MNDDLLNKVESLKLMLVSRATGGLGDEGEHNKLRRELISSSRLAQVLPKSVHVCRNLSEFWNFIQPKSPTYAGRREYLRAEFGPLLTMLETDARSPSDAAITATVQV